MSAALERAQAVLQREGGEIVTTVTRKMFTAALDRDELTEVILTRWHEYAADRTEQPPRAFAEQFAADVIANILGEHIHRRGDAVVQAADPSVRGRVLDVLFDGVMLTVKWFGGDVVTINADQVSPA